MPLFCTRDQTAGLQPLKFVHVLEICEQEVG